jgi:spermidine/putrescine transport system permease protein
VAMFFVFTALFTTVHLGTLAEVLGLVTWNVSWPAIIVQARLVTLGKQYEEAAADLGANQFQTMRRVMLPLLGPAIFASAVLVFSSVIDDFVIVDLLSSNAGNTPMSVIIYSTQHGGNGGPALNALGTIMLAMSFVIAIIGYIGYRWLTRGERGSQMAALSTFAGAEG